MWHYFRPDFAGRVRTWIVFLALAITVVPDVQRADAAPERLAEACASIEELLARPLETVSDKLGSKPIARKTAAGAEKLVAGRLVDDLLDWIAANTRYDVSETRRNKPTISFCDFGEHLDYEHKDLVVESILRGIYDKEKRHIYPVAPWSPENLKNVGTLLHELIHDVQLLNREWPCWGRAEWEAYKLQETWLKARGVDPEFPWIRIFLGDPLRARRPPLKRDVIRLNSLRLRHCERSEAIQRSLASPLDCVGPPGLAMTRL